MVYQVTKLICALIILFLSSSSFATTDLLLDPYPQATFNICKPYSTAFSMAHSFLLSMPVETPRQLNQKTRLKIDKVAQENKINRYHHAVWAEIIIIPSQNLKPTRFYPAYSNQHYQNIQILSDLYQSPLLKDLLSAALLQNKTTTLEARSKTMSI